MIDERADLINSVSKIETEEIKDIKFHGGKNILKITDDIKDRGVAMKDRIIIF